jgi:hypothetical protein
MRIEWVETELGNRLPPEALEKPTQQDLGPFILDHHATFGDHSTDVFVCKGKNSGSPYRVDRQARRSGCQHNDACRGRAVIECRPAETRATSAS